MKLTEVQERYPAYNETLVRENLRKELHRDTSKIIVLDDDPTGVQTVHDTYVYTDCSRESVRGGLNDKRKLFYILTNSRSFDVETTVQLHREIANNVLAESTGEMILISRSDSTLRGHYPLETATLESVLAENDIHVDGEIIYPFFSEGGRYTIDHIHYVLSGDDLVPVGETEFAKDLTFGYQNSDLTKWVEEKTDGAYAASKVTRVTLDDLRSMDYDGIISKLDRVSNFGKVIVDSLSYEDVMVFATAFYRSIAAGKRFIFRSAASLVQVLGGIERKPLLIREELVPDDNPNGGLIVIGSHVKKTSDQLERLRTRSDLFFVEMNQHLVVDPPAFEQERIRISNIVNEKISEGTTVAVYTKRDRFDLNTENKADELRAANEISMKLTDIVRSLEVKPSFLVGKGGITSSDIGTKGLEVRKAMVMGQILPGVPVWLTGDESRFSGSAIHHIPGNVGDENGLVDVVRLVKGEF